MQIIGQICTFEAPFGGLGAMYDVHLRVIEKLVGDFLLVIIELFSLGAFVLSQYTRLTDRQNLDSNTVRIYASQSHGKNRVTETNQHYSMTRQTDYVVAVYQ